ncbi:MAG: putative zinc-binding protein [Pirellulales bacterium]
MAETTKVGIIACSGEEIPAGTLSRLATRRVLELLRPQSTVTLCLPLFLAGEEQERRFARQHPTITVDGCDKLCAKRGTEQYSAKVAASLVVTDIVGERVAKCHRSARDYEKSDEESVRILAERIAAEVDALSATAPLEQPLDSPKAASCGCSCDSPPPEGRLDFSGKMVTVPGLPLIFDHLYEQDLRPGESCADQVLETVRIYHEISEGEEMLYRDALAVAYQEYYDRRTK